MDTNINSYLDKNEDVILFGRLHWFYIIKPLAASILFFITSVILFFSSLKFNYDILLYSGCILLFMCIVSYTWGYIVRIKTEYAITSSRLIQKEGIFDIKITEIPLFKVETVNFYQTFWQRLLNTGVIELVGSGGTSHVIRYLQDPNKVRNVIMSSINSKTSKYD